MPANQIESKSAYYLYTRLRLCNFKKNLKILHELDKNFKKRIKNI